MKNNLEEILCGFEFVNLDRISVFIGDITGCSEEDDWVFDELEKIEKEQHLAKIMLAVLQMASEGNLRQEEIRRAYLYIKNAIKAKG